MDYRGKSVFYKVQGSGVPVVLLHGYLESMDIWNGFAGDLARSVRVITLDLPGHGRSDVLGEVHRMEDLAAVVKKVIETIVPDERVLLTGHSLGGYVTLAFAEKYPELLSAYCLFHSHPLADTEEVKQNRMREIELVEAGKKELIYQVNIPKAFAEENEERYREEILRATEVAKNTSDAGISAMLRGMMLRPDRRRLLEEAALPVLWILGEGDRYIPYEKMMTTIHPSARVTVKTLKHSGHMGFIEEKEESLQILTGFADKLQRAVP